MPHWFQTLTWFFPFRWCFCFPIIALIGPITTRDLFIGMGMQVAWILFSIGLLCGRVAAGRTPVQFGGRMRSPDPYRGGRLRLVGTFLRVGVMNEMQYRINFFLQLVQSILTVGTGLIVLAVVFSKTDELGGWSRPQLLAVMGVFTLVGGIIRTFIQPNMQRVVEDVREGKLDFALTKPADAQMLVSVRDVRFWQLTDVLVGLAVLVAALVQLTSTMAVAGRRAVRRCCCSAASCRSTASG